MRPINARCKQAATARTARPALRGAPASTTSAWFPPPAPPFEGGGTSGAPSGTAAQAASANACHNQCTTDLGQACYNCEAACVDRCYGQTAAAQSEADLACRLGKSRHAESEGTMSTQSVFASIGIVTATWLVGCTSSGVGSHQRGAHLPAFAPYGTRRARCWCRQRQHLLAGDRTRIS